MLASPLKPAISIPLVMAVAGCVGARTLLMVMSIKPSLLISWIVMVSLEAASPATARRPEVASNVTLDGLIRRSNCSTEYLRARRAMAVRFLATIYRRNDLDIEHLAVITRWQNRRRHA